MDYCGNVIYENGALKRVLIDGGYIEGGAYDFYLQDHLGNNQMVADASGNIKQTNHYYPFGMSFAEGTVTSSQPYKYNGKELDTNRGLNLHDYSARYMDPALGRFNTVDPMAEKYYSISPYAHCLNNPMKYIDPSGKDPGDVFKTKRLAAIDWGMYYNGASILRRREFGSTIYEVQSNGKVIGYAYSEAKEGSAHGVVPNFPPNKEKTVADIHSHGNDDIGYDDNHFSEADKKDNSKKGINGYLASPNGFLQEYNTLTEKVSIISRNLPSDPKDPDRQNKKNPVDIPAEKKRIQTTVEQQQKPELKLSEIQKDRLIWAF